MYRLLSAISILVSSLGITAQNDSLKIDLGTISGEWRTFYMLTNNTKNLKDFNALATGGHIKYQYDGLKNIEFGSALYTSWNIGIQDLTIPDQLTGKNSRYEEGLFDRLDLEDESVFIVGELYASYQLKHHNFKLGRMRFNSPFMNAQDGRMLPSLFQGLHYTFNSQANTTFQFAAFNAIAPRSTGKFFTIGKSFGTYPIARNNSGNPSLYDQNNTKSDFVIITNLNQQINENLTIELWNYFIENVSNSVYIKPSYQISDNVSVQAEWLHQNKINNGGNKLDSLSYFQDNASDLLGLKIFYGWDPGNSLSLAYNRILPHGKFLFPREWGREFIFTFQKRERSEGISDHHALVAYYDQHFDVFDKNLNIRSVLSAGQHWNPSLFDPAANKYAMPSYTQLNLDLFFNFRKFKNLKPEVLLVQKFGNGDLPDNPNFYFNKVNMFQLNFVVNYVF